MTSSTEPRCETTELLVSQCGCRRHRGGRTPEEAAELDRVIYGPGPWFFARWGGWCERGCHRFVVGTAVRYDGSPENTMECQGCAG
jgi:hypothetical protein